MLIVRFTIGSFSLAALLGVIALLGGGAFGSVEGRILLTTLLVGVVSVVVLCYLLTAGTRHQAVGAVGGVVVIVALLSAMPIIWYDYETDVPAWLARTFGVSAVAALSLAQASLLLAIGSRSGPVVHRLLLATLGLASVLALQVSALILGLEPPASYVRLLGVVAILDVLGTVVVTALSRFGAGRPARGAPGAPGVTGVPGGSGVPGAAGAPGDSRPLAATVSDVPLPAALVGRARERGLATGRTTEEVVASAVEAYLAESPVP